MVTIVIGVTGASDWKSDEGGDVAGFKLVILPNSVKCSDFIIFLKCFLMK